jgi:hypothetical protein
MNIIDFNHSPLKNGGWNITLGGDNDAELMLLKMFLSGKIEKDLTKYSEKIHTERFCITEPNKE